MPENQVLKYQTSMDQTQNLDIMGQFVETETSSFSGFSVKSKGSLDGKGEQMGTDLTSEGEIEGSDTLYFTYKKGIFVKETVDILT